jgi:glycosyltransferase involved in cell wall biosynthesis
MLKTLLAGLRNRHRRRSRTASLAAELPVATRWVAFIAEVDELRQVSPGERLYSRLGSTRLRVLIPAEELARLLPVCVVPLERMIGALRPDALGTPAAIVLGKLAARRVAAMARELDPFLNWIAARARMTPVFADLSDDYAAHAPAFGAPFLAEYQQRLAEHCTLVVPCAALRDALAPRTRREIVVIEDPYESPTARPVRVGRSAPLRLCWFGNLGQLNVGLLAREFRAIARDQSGPGTQFQLVTDVSSRRLVEEVARAVSEVDTRSQVSFTQWSLAAARAAVEASDFVLLPQDYESAWGRVKSHNRLVEAIRGGRFALASPVPAYEELSDYAWVDGSLAAGLRWAQEHPQQAADRVRAGQTYVEARFAPRVIGQKWAQVLGVA